MGSLDGGPVTGATRIAHGRGGDGHGFSVLIRCRVVDEAIKEPLREAKGEEEPATHVLVVVEEAPTSVAICFVFIVASADEGVEVQLREAEVDEEPLMQVFY